MISTAIPGVGEFHWSHLVLDVNGTLTTDGALLPGVVQRLHALSSQVTVHLLTADTRGTAFELARDLGVDCRRVERSREAEQKRAQVQALGAGRVIHPRASDHPASDSDTQRMTVTTVKGMRSSGKLRLVSSSIDSRRSVVESYIPTKMV